MKLALLLSLVLSVALVTDAAACSCVGPEALYEDAEVAFVGTVTARSEERDAQRVRYSIDVERVFKGEISGRREYRAMSSEASCGVELEVGERVGIIEAPDARELYLCSVVSPSELERIAQPLPRATREGSPAFLVGGAFGTFNSASLDERGRIIRYGRRRLGATEVCPGGRRFATLSGRHVNVRRVDDLSQVRRLRAANGSAVRCLSASGRRLAVFAQESGGGRLLLLSGTRRRDFRLRDATGEVALGRDRALISRGTYERPEVHVIDYRTGMARRILESSRLVFGLGLDPAERRAFVMASGIGRGTAVSVVELAGATRTRELGGDVEYAIVSWYANDAVAVATGERLQLFSPDTLETVGDTGGWPFAFAMVGSQPFGMTDEGELVRAQDGEVRSVALLPRANIYPFVAIPTPRPTATTTSTTARACSWSALQPISFSRSLTNPG